MKDELLKELIDIIKGTKSFVIQEAPDVAKEMIHYAVASSCLGILISAILAFISYKLLRTAKESHDNDDDGIIEIVAWAGVVMMGISSLVTFSCSASTLLQASVSPKVYLLENLTSLLK